MKLRFVSVLAIFLASLYFIACDSRDSFVKPSTPIDFVVIGDTVGIPSGYDLFVKVLNAQDNEKFILNASVLSGDRNATFLLEGGQNLAKNQEVTRNTSLTFKGRVGSYTIEITMQRKSNPELKFAVTKQFKIVEPDIIFSLSQAIDNDSCKVGVGQRLLLKSLLPAPTSVTAILPLEFELRDENYNTLNSPFEIAGRAEKVIILLPKLTANFNSYLFPFVHKSINRGVTFQFSNGQSVVEKNFNFLIFDNLPPFMANMSGRADFNSSTNTYQYLITLHQKPIDRDAKWNTEAQNQAITTKFLEYDNVSSFCISGSPAKEFRISTLNTSTTLPPNVQGCQGSNTAEVFRLVAVAQDLDVGIEKNLSVGSNASSCTCCTSSTPFASPQSNFTGTSVTFVRVRAKVRHTDSNGGTTEQFVNIEFNR